MASEKEEIETACLLLAKALLILDDLGEEHESVQIHGALQRLADRHRIDLPGGPRRRRPLN